MKKTLLTISVSITLLLSQLSYGEWELVSDFNDASGLDVVTDVTNQEGSNARTEIVDGRLAAYPGVALESTSNLFAGINLGTDIRARSVELDGPITVYFQLIQPTVSDGQGGTRKAIVDTVFGLTHFGSLEWTTETYNSYNAMARINFGNDSLEVRDDTSYVPQDNGVLMADTVYKIWMEIDYAFNEWQGYVQGGQFTERTKLLGVDGNEFLGFRKIPGFEIDGTTPQKVENLLIALSRGNIEAEKGQDPTYFDNFYIDLTGVNTSDPVGGGSNDTWAGYTVLSTGDVDTGSWLGWVSVVGKPWIWSYTLNHFLYIEEAGVGSSGGWVYIPK